MSYITTYLKKHIDPTNASANDIEIVDIAHALSLLCRANGHFKHFYSVAQHSINCVKEAKARGYSKRVQLGCLLHDASEAYLSDVTRPIKAQLQKYLEIEEKLQNTIFDKWITPSLNTEEVKQIFEIDDAVLYYEFLNLLDEKISGVEPQILSKPNYDFSNFSEVESEFISRFKMLMGEISGNYNCESNLINTDGEDIRSFLTEPFATSLRTISVYQNGEYFKDALSGTKFIPFIQNINEPQKISCMPVNPPVITTGKHVTNVACENILGMIWDRRGTFLTATKIETGYMENNYDKWTNYVHNFSVREMCDKGSNAVVFVAKDKSGSNKAYTITEANDA